MNKKKIIISALCMALLLAMPVQAYADVCTHPKLYPAPEGTWVYHGYDTAFYQHHEWFQHVEYICIRCGAEILGDKEYKDWEDHDWNIDWSNPDDHGNGLVYYNAFCETCGYADDLNNFEIEDLGL